MWGLITLDPGGPGRAPDEPGSGPLPPDVIYTLDASDRLESVGGAWNRFASENGAGSLLGPAVVGRPIWSFFSGREVRSIYQALFSTIRKRGKPVRLPFRCDSSALLRSLELAIHPRPDGGLTFVSRTLAVSARGRPVRLLEPSTIRGTTLLTMCAWCKSVMWDGAWRELDDAVGRYGILTEDPLPGITHGICPTCRATMEAS